MVTLDHGPISGLMPAMRMAFPVQQVELLKGLQVGDVVRFSLQPRGPEWVIAAIEPAEDRRPPRPVIFPAPDFALPTLSGETVRVFVVSLWALPARAQDKFIMGYGNGT